jgi:sugar phosphate isomerase/epimerase
MTEANFPELVFAAGTLMTHDILERAAAVPAGGFSCTSCFVGDILGWEEAGRPLAALRREMEARGAPIDTLLPIVDWHPRWDPRCPTGPAAVHGGRHVTATKADALRWAEQLGARTITLVGPWGGPDAPFTELFAALGAFADDAAAIGARLQLEVVPASKIPDIDTAVTLIEGVGRANLGMLLDTYNMGRAGTTLDELDRLPLEMVFGLELADAASEQHGDDYFTDALHHRLLPGEGDLGVAAMAARLAARGPLPPCGFEVMSDALNQRPAADVGALAGDVMRRFLRAIIPNAT